MQSFQNPKGPQLLNCVKLLKPLANLYNASWMTNPLSQKTSRFIRDRRVEGAGGACAPPIFLSVWCPPLPTSLNIEALMVPPIPQSQSCSAVPVYLCNTLCLLFFRNMDVVTSVEKMCGATFYIKGATFEQLFKAFLSNSS